MVGVPRSKGCLTCRKRMIKCDEGRPSCSQCNRGNRECPGYKPSFKFVDEGPTLIRKARSSLGPNNAKKIRSSILIHNSHASTHKNVFSDNGNSLEPENNRQPLITTILSPNLEQIQFVTSFISAVFPLEGLYPHLSHLGTCFWTVPQYLTQSKALDLAAQCLGLGYFGRSSENQGLISNSQQIYSYALRQISRDISNVESGFSSTTLCAIMLLGLYETFMCTESTSWIKHAGGARRLMQLRGANRHKEGFDYIMFLAIRGMIIAEALASGQSCFLDSEDWRSISIQSNTSSIPRHFYFYDELCNYYAAVPGVVKRAKLIATSNIDVETRLSVLLDAHTLRNNLYSWRKRFLASFDQNKPAIAEVPSKINESIFSCVYAYESIHIAAWLTTHFAHLIILNAHIDSLQSEKCYIEENKALAANICKSIEYCSQAGVCGTQVMIFSLPIASSVSDDEQKEWIGERFSKFRNSLATPYIQMF